VTLSTTIKDTNKVGSDHKAKTWGAQKQCYFEGGLDDKWCSWEWPVVIDQKKRGAAKTDWGQGTVWVKKIPTKPESFKAARKGNGSNRDRKI